MEHPHNIAVTVPKGHLAVLHPCLGTELDKIRLDASVEATAHTGEAVVDALELQASVKPVHGFGAVHVERRCNVACVKVATVIRVFVVGALNGHGKMRERNLHVEDPCYAVR